MNVLELKKKAIEVRRGALELAHRSQGHIGGALSSCDVITALFYDIMDIDPASPEGDRFILSKGHTCEAYYWVLADRGFFEKSELESFNRFGSRFFAHPSRDIPGVDFSTGSLGHGLSLAGGVALGMKKRASGRRCFVVMGDGETDEGSVWEAAMFASGYHLDNLYAVVDRNHLQISGDTERVMPLEPYADKWRAFGFEVIEADGNDMEQVLRAFREGFSEAGKPKLLLADTVKGKGVSFMENDASWHHGSLSDEQFSTAMAELDREREALG